MTTPEIKSIKQIAKPGTNLPGRGSSDGTYIYIPIITSGIVTLSKYDAQGSLIWERNVSNAASWCTTATATDRTILVASSSNGESGRTSALTKFSPAGEKIWDINIQHEFVHSVTVSEDTVYTSGGIGKGFNNTNIAWINAYSLSKGTLLWSKTYPNSGAARISDLQIVNGSIYAAAQLYGKRDFDTAIAGKLDLNGNEIWWQSAPSSDWNAIWSIKVSGDQILGVGYKADAGDRVDVRLISFNETNGIIRWDKSWGDGNDQQIGNMEILNGKVYIAYGDGVPRHSSSNSVGYSVVDELDTSGNQLNKFKFDVQGSYDGGGSLVNTGNSLFMLGSTNGVISGQTSGGEYDVFLASLILAPLQTKPQWLTHSGQSTNDSSAGIALFSNSDIATAQSVTKTNGASSVFVQRITSAGLVVWSLDIGADFAPSAGSILVGSDDKVYVVGGTKLDADGESGKNDSDVFAAAVSSTGSKLWYKNYRTGIHEIGSSAVIDKNGNILMDGRVSEYNDVYTMIKDVPNFYGADFSGGWRGFQLRINPSDGSISKAYTTGSFNSGSGPVAIDRSRNIAYVPGYTFGSVNGVNTVGNGDTNGANTYLIARDETTGAVLWTRMENWIRSNLVIQESEDAIYFVDKGILEKVKGSTGVTQWAKPIDNTHYTLSPIKGGGILLSEANSTGTLTIKRYDQNGTETGSQLINHTGNLQPNKFIENGDGILIVSGTTTGAITIPSDAAIRTPKQAGSDAFILSINSQFSTPVISPSYAISPSATTINEGGTLTSTVKTSNVASGTSLYYSLSGSGINSDDFSSGAITGSGKVETPQGSFSFTHIIKNDLVIEGPEYLQIKLFSDSDRKQEVANAAVTINDAPSGSAYSIKSYLPTTTIGTGQTTQPKASFDEGERIYSVVSTTNVSVGSTLYYSISGIGIESVDFTSGALSGSAKVGTLGTFSLSHTLKKDAKTEGLEILQIKLFSDNARTNQVGLTHTLEINDTSIETPKAIFNGTKNKDTLVGNSANNIFKGLGSADTLTGMGGADTFKYALSDSRLTGFDHITDFAIGTDIIDGPSTVSSLNLKELGTVSSLTQVDISAVLTSTNFIRGGAATFSLGGGSSSRTFLALNDSRAGFQSTYDAIIEITGFSGRLTDLAIK